MKTNYLLFIFTLFFLACQAQQEAKSQEKDAYLDIVNGDSLMKEFNDGEILSTVLQSMTSPLEISELVQKSVKKIDTNNLCVISNNYQTNNQKALAMGIYAVNFGYCNMYGLQEKQISYLKEIERLADELDIKNHIQFDSIYKNSKENNLEALINEMQRGFEKIANNNKTGQQNYESFLLLVSFWVEANYQTLLLYDKLQKEKTDTAVVKQWKDRIGEQKITIEMLSLVVALFKPYDRNRYIGNDIKELQKNYETITIITKVEPTCRGMGRGDCVLLETPTESIVKISDTTISKIFEKIKEIRSKIVK
jgi:hypothetical protein